MTRNTLYLLGTTALTGALIATSTLEGCRANSASGLGGSVGVGGAGSSSSSSSASSTSGAGGVAAEDVTIPQITDPTNPNYVSNTVVKLTGVVAMSPKFLISKSKSSGACLWGVFLSTAGIATTGPNTGILAVNNGTPATASGDAGTVYCPVPQAGMPAGDLFPDDTAPGDVFDVIGKTTSYVPSTCGAPDAAPPDNSNVAQYQLENLVLVTRTSRGAPVPQPAVISDTVAQAIAAGSDKTTLNQWGGVKVTVQNVTAVLQEGMTFDSYGHMLMDDGLQVGDKIYYVGYVKATDVCYGPPGFPSTVPHFNSVSGFVYLDFCTWGLSPTSKCTDLDPPSEDCASLADAGPDASSNGSVCYY